MQNLLKKSFVGRKIEEVNLWVKNHGVAKSMATVIKKTGSRFEVENKTKRIVELFKSGKVLLISNHPAEVDVLMLLSTWVKRKDCYLIANHSLLGILPELDKHIIPVYINHRVMKNKWFNRMKLKILKKFHQSTVYGKEVAHSKNIENIKLAAKRISMGGMVTIFPINAEENNRFMPGVGHILRNVESIDDMWVIMARIEGTSNFDYLRLVPGLGRLLPKLKVIFSEPMESVQFVDDEAKMVAKKMQLRYDEWTKEVLKKTAVARGLFNTHGRLALYLRTLVFWIIQKGA